MILSDKDRKLLWTRAGNRCSYRFGAETCGQPLSLGEATSAVVVGEECHIVGEKMGSARFIEDVADRETYSNAILLCGTHHKLVDDKETRDQYPPDLLRSMKRDHEQAVASSSPQTTLHDSAFSLEAKNVDLAVGLDVSGPASLSGVSAKVTATNVGEAYGARLQGPVKCIFSTCKYCAFPMTAVTVSGAKPVFRCPRCGREQ